MPFRSFSLVGNVPEAIITEVKAAGLRCSFDADAFQKAQSIKHELFGVAVSELILSQYLNDDDVFSSLCRTHFDAADTDSSRFLDEEQFRASVLQVLSELGEEASDDRVLKIFKETDVGSDGKINFDEYVAAARAKLQKRMAD